MNQDFKKGFYRHCNHNQRQNEKFVFHFDKLWGRRQTKSHFDLVSFYFSTSLSLFSQIKQGLGEPRNPYWRGRISTMDLHVLTSSNYLLLLQANIFFFFYKTCYLNKEVNLIRDRRREMRDNVLHMFGPMKERDQYNRPPCTN